MSPSFVEAAPPTTEPPPDTTTTTTTTLPDSPCSEPATVTEWAVCEQAQAATVQSGALWLLVLLVVALLVLYALRGPHTRT